MAAPYSMDLRERVLKAWDARHITTRVQHGRDAFVGVLVEELIDQRHDLSARLTQLPGVERAGEGERGGRASSKAKVRREPVRGFDERDILEQETDHPFSFAVGRVGSVPESWEVRRQSENPRAGVGVSAHALGLSVMVIGLLRVDNVLQRAIPLGF